MKIIKAKNKITNQIEEFEVIPNYDYKKVGTSNVWDNRVFKMEYELTSTPPDCGFDVQEIVKYKEEERKIVSINHIEDLFGLEPTWEPEETVWVRMENCSKLD